MNARRATTIHSNHDMPLRIASILLVLQQVHPGA